MPLFNDGDIIYLRSDDKRENPYNFSHYEKSGMFPNLFETGMVVCHGKKTKRSKKILKLVFRESDLTK